LPEIESEKLAWPPTKEDLERLYLVERLSAAKIANVYGLKYKNPKVAESTVLYHLKRSGIQRRDKAEHVRKVTEEMVDIWVRRYRGGESLKQIAGGELSSVTVYLHLRKRGVRLRDKLEAQIAAVEKYERRPFAGDRLERAYLLGLRHGDFDVVRHGRTIRVRVSTTHPAMAELFENLFSPYGHVSHYPRTSQLTRYEWTLECDLDSSFRFLLFKLKIENLKSFTPEEFKAFLAGFFDAEGSILFHKKKQWGGFELSIPNMNLTLLELIADKLEADSCKCVVELVRQKADRGTKGGQDYIWRLAVYRAEDVRSILRDLQLRHSEKVAKAKIALKFPTRPDGFTLKSTKDRWRILIKQIRNDRNHFVLEAAAALDSKIRLERAKGEDSGSSGQDKLGTSYLSASTGQ